MLTRQESRNQFRLSAAMLLVLVAGLVLFLRGSDPVVAQSAQVDEPESNEAVVNGRVVALDVAVPAAQIERVNAPTVPASRVDEAVTIVVKSSSWSEHDLGDRPFEVVSAVPAHSDSGQPGVALIVEFQSPVKLDGVLPFLRQDFDGFEAEVKSLLAPDVCAFTATERSSDPEIPDSRFSSRGYPIDASGVRALLIMVDTTNGCVWSIHVAPESPPGIENPGFNRSGELSVRNLMEVEG